VIAAMPGKEARLRNRRRELVRFLDRFCPKLDKPRRKFFAQGLWGILQSCSLVVSRWLRYIPGGLVPDRCAGRFSRPKRLLNQLKSPAWDHRAVLEEYQRSWARHVEPDTPLVVDLTDLPRPRARKLKYLAPVRDGSSRDRHQPRLVNGYWCLEIYAYLCKGRTVPLLLEPYSIEDPQTLSENAMILRSVDRVLAATQGRGVLVMDAGGDRDRLLIPWVDDGRKFVVRLRSDRHLVLDDGTHVEAEHLAETLLSRRRGQIRIASCRVYLPERPGCPLYLVCKAVEGRDRPLIVLSSLNAEDDEQAARVLRYYHWRWKCEESARFLKSRLGLEHFALRTYEAFGRLLLLAALVMGLLTWMQLAMPSLRHWLCGKAPGRREIKFAYYRLLDWLQEQILPAPPKAAPP
jgi:hypothetical protein